MNRWLYPLIGIGWLVAIYFCWQLGRSWNYNLAYEGLVRDTVCGLVKEEYLKEPCDGN